MSELKKYRHRKTAKVVHAKPAPTHGNVMLFYGDRNGRPSGQVRGTTVEKFNEQYELLTRAVAH